MKKRVLMVFGTRPEAIKMATLALSLKRNKDINFKICITSQHTKMLAQVMNFFKIKADYDLKVMKKAQSLSSLTSRIILKLEPIFEKFKPDLVMVHGDTSTTLASSLSAYYHQTKICHIEAGLRTHNKYSPWPEEMNRNLVGSLADLNFAPTESSKNNLLKEGVKSKDIHVVGNTVIDALKMTINIINGNPGLEDKIKKSLPNIDYDKKIVLVTGHRRENFGDGIKNICKALLEISKRKDVQIIYPVHLNPNVKDIVNKKLGNSNNIFLIEPVTYEVFTFLINKSYLILTDSGGIQEEAPALGKPVLVMRDTTERDEAIKANTAILVGTKDKMIISRTFDLLDNKVLYKKMAVSKNPFGDGKSTQRIIKKILNFLNESK
jgi:UDP-N-acetylglucosamine 2-epimerase (non-hydrolysing)